MTTPDSQTLVFLPDQEFTISGPVVSGDRSSEIIYQFIRTDIHTWVFPADLTTPDASDYIYVRHTDERHSQGFGGRLLKFPLADGASITLQGPWKSNPDALFEYTGVDLRNACLTMGIVALEEHHLEFGRARYSQVLHADTVPVSGPYDRIADIAQHFADQLQRPVHYANRARGGGSMSYKRPTTPEAPILKD